MAQNIKQTFFRPQNLQMGQMWPGRPNQTVPSWDTLTENTDWLLIELGWWPQV